MEAHFIVRASGDLGAIEKAYAILTVGLDGAAGFLGLQRIDQPLTAGHHISLAFAHRLGVQAKRAGDFFTDALLFDQLALQLQAIHVGDP